MTTSVLIAGDCGPAYDPAQQHEAGQLLELIEPVLRTADFRLVNCMRTYSARAAVSADAPQVSQPTHMAELYFRAGFDGVTLANNHAYDSGPDALVDTVNLFKGRGIQVTGAGRTLTDASRPVVLEKNSLRIGYLGCTSVGKPGATATVDKPGVLNVAVEASFEPRGAHAAVRVRTLPDERDLAALIATVRKVRADVDILIVAYHSGVIRLPRVISDYQVTVSRALVDAGADLIVCHAPHIPKGIEVYKGKAIFYSVGVFAMTKSFPAPSWLEPAWAHGAVRNHTDLDPHQPSMPYGKDSRYGLLVRGAFDKDGTNRISFVPMQFDRSNRPEPLQSGDPRFKDLLDYMEWASVDLPHSFHVEGNEIVVTE